MHLARRIAGVLSLSLLACRDRPVDRPEAAPPLNSADSVLAVASKGVLPDTASPAYKQLNLMSAPIHMWPLAARGSDSLRWAAQLDSCGLVVVSRHEGNVSEPRDNAVLVAEWFGSAQFGDVWDIAPSPKWDWIAYGQVRRIAAPGDVDTAAAETKTPRGELLARVIRTRNGAEYLAIPVIEPLLNTCSGDECPLDAASPTLGGARVGWNDTGSVALVAGSESSPRWTAVSPTTREPIALSTIAPAHINWASHAISELVTGGHPTISGGGEYRFSTRHDSIFVDGPSRTSRNDTRFVGPGIPVAATRHGQYLLALRREKQEWRAVIYEFVLFHAMMSSSCDRPGAT
jgi:hypothetical protein